MPNFTLKDVISDSILDPDTGWRDRLPEEIIVLTDQERTSFLEVLGKGRRANTKAALRRFIENPRAYAASLVGAFWCDRLEWRGGRCCYCAGQDYPYELSQIAARIREIA